MAGLGENRRVDADRELVEQAAARSRDSVGSRRPLRSLPDAAIGFRRKTLRTTSTMNPTGVRVTRPAPFEAPSSASGSKGLPLFVRAADLLTGGLLTAAMAVALTGGWIFWLGEARVTVRSPIRILFWALVVVIVRHVLYTRPPFYQRLFSVETAERRIEEHGLFESSRTAPARRAAGAALLVAGFSALVVALTWPQIWRLDAVADLGDPLFSIWRISWVNHQLLRHPLDVYNGNIFYPEPLTLTYSDSVIVPSLMTAPLYWLGVHQLTIYNLLFLSAFALSGVTMFLLVRALTGRRDAAIVAGVLFALYPYRYEHYSHLELQMTMWMPLALLGLHRTLSRGRLRDGLLTGLASALQTLSSLYYGVFLGVYLAVVGAILWCARGFAWRPVWTLTAGMALTAILIAPVATQYRASETVMAGRNLPTIQFYSAGWSDYVKTHGRSRVYQALATQTMPERALFPTLTPLVLSAVALWPPLSVARFGYLAALLTTVDGTFGFNGFVYRSLYDHASPVHGMRVPARFGIFVGMTLAILSGYGAARLLRRWPRWQAVLTVAMVTAAIVEAFPRMPLHSVWRQPPPIYAKIPEPHAVLAEFPMPADDTGVSVDTVYMYFSTFHWHRLINGYSGYYPSSYLELMSHERDFPSDTAVNYLKARGVDYVTIHGAFYGSPDLYRETIALVDARGDMQLVAAMPWESAETRLYRLRRDAATR